MEDDTIQVENGVDVTALLETREKLRTDPESAKFQWVANCEWINGTYTKSSVRNFFGFGREQHHKQTFVISSDHPECLAASDNGPAPVEIALCSLASCLCAGVAAVAQRRDVQLRSIKARVEADMDVRGIFGTSEDTRNGPESAVVVFEIDGEVDREEIKAIVEQSRARSAIFDLFTNSSNVKLVIA